MSDRPLSTPAQLAVNNEILKRLEAGQEADRAARARETEETRAARAAMTKELERLAAHAEKMDERMGKVEPVTQMVTSWRFVALGAMGILGIVGGAIASLAKLLGFTFNIGGPS